MRSALRAHEDENGKLKKLLAERNRSIVTAVISP